MPRTPSTKSSAKKGRRKSSAVPYARGFAPPSTIQQVQAIGFKDKPVPQEYATDPDTDGLSFFPPIPHPNSIDDWLAQYNEEGQTYRQYRQENPWFSKRSGKYLTQTFNPLGNTLHEKYPDGKIYIASIGDIDRQTNVCFNTLIDYIKRFLCLPVKVLEGLTIERKDKELIFVEDPSHHPDSRPGSRIKKSTLTTRYNSKTQHVQISVDSILPKLRLHIPRDALCLVGLTPYDLYGDETDLFVAGMAAGLRRVAVFSLLRYNPSLSFSTEFWYDIKKVHKVKPDEEKRLMLQRSCKLVVHEICHLLGIDHCIFFSCCMNGSGHLQEDFAQPMMLCPVDLHKLQALVGFDVKSRYTSLLEFFRRNNLHEEADWMERRLAFLNSGGES